MKTSCYRLVNSSGVREGDKALLHRSTRTRVSSPKLQQSWERTYEYNVNTSINDRVCMIQWHPRAKMMVLQWRKAFSACRGFSGWAALRREQCCLCWAMRGRGLAPVCSRLSFGRIIETCKVE
jgi:hypothetical protein